MSRAHVFKVCTTGSVIEYGAVLNGAAYVFPLLDTLMARYEIAAPQGHAGVRATTRYRSLFAEFGSGKLSWEDDLALATVYQEVWVSKEHVPALLRGLLSVATSLPPSIHPSIHDVAMVVKRVVAEPDCRGVAFDVANEAECFWVVEDDHDGDGQHRPYNVDNDVGRLGDRGDAFEAGAELMRLRSGSSKEG